MEKMDGRRYLEEHGLNRLFKDMLTCLLEDRPVDPIDYMADGLCRLKSAPTNPRPVSFLHFFHTPSPSPAVVVAATTTNKTSDTADPVMHSGNADDDGEQPLDLAALKQLSLQHQAESGTVLPADFCTARRKSVSAESYQPKAVSDDDDDDDDDHDGNDKKVGKEDKKGEPDADSYRRRASVCKSPNSRQRIEHAVCSNLLFKNLDDDQKNRILDAMFERRVKADEMVIQQGDEGDNFYVIESGRYQVIVNGEPKDVLEAGKTFGELALMYNCKRTASVVALEPGVLWAVDRDTFKRTVINLAYRKRLLYEGFLRSVPLLSKLEQVEISKIADALEPVQFQPGETVITEGDFGEDFYIIVSGEAIIKKGGLEIERLHSGNYFGEVALLEHKPRTATVVASDELKCVVLSESAFQRLLGPLKDILERNKERYIQNVC